MIPQLTLTQTAALVVVAIGTVTDIKSRKIPNILTFPAALLALALQSFQSGLPGAIAAIGGWLVGCLITASPILLMRLFRAGNKMGFGDVKLMGAVGAFLGPKLTLIVFFYFCLFYGALGIARIATVIPWKKLVMLFVAPGTDLITAQDMEKIRQMRKSHMPLGPAIFAGTLCTILLEEPTLQFFGFM